MTSTVVLKPAPDLGIPKSSSTVIVSLVENTAKMTVPVKAMLKPAYLGHEDIVAAPCHVFHITHPSSNRSMLFDLSVRKDWKESFAPSALALFNNIIVDVESDVADILQKSNVDVKSGAMDAVIWSHHHLDHTGNMATFPGSTQLIVGPGFKDGLMPGFPVNPESDLLESDFEGRKVVEVGFEGLKIGGFRANDYFGDGSFYLLDSPGHAIGHLCALARVTEDTFIFMGADACHHGGEFRPTEYLPIPEEVNTGAVFDHASPRGFCPRSLFEKLTPHNKPFYQASEKAAYDYAKMEDTIMKLEAFDAAENVWVVIARDGSLLESEIGVEFFPTGTLNNWKKDDLAEKTRWTFLKDFEVAAKAAV